MEALADEIMTECLGEALDEMCVAHMEQSARLAAFAAEQKQQPQGDKHPALTVEVPASGGSKGSPLSPGENSPPSSLRHLPPLSRPAHVPTEAASPPQSPSPSPQRQDSFASRTEDSGSEYGGDDTVRCDQKYVFSYVRDVMRAFLTSQVRASLASIRPPLISIRRSNIRDFKKRFASRYVYRLVKLITEPVHLLGHTHTHTHMLIPHHNVLCAGHITV